MAEAVDEQGAALRELMRRLDVLARQRGIEPDTEIDAATMMGLLVEARDQLADEVDADRARIGLPKIRRPWEGDA